MKPNSQKLCAFTPEMQDYDMMERIQMGRARPGRACGGTQTRGLVGTGQ